ncbi:hypothetical protein EB151_00525, partial [archaeon]|nr:hypothetical protein [archaeon]
MNAAGGFIPNFGNLDVGARSMLVNSGITPFVVDLQRKTMAASSAGDDMFHSQIVNKKFVDPVTGKPIYPKLYDDDIHSAAWKDIFVRGFVDSGTGKVSFDLTEPQKKDKNFMQKHSALLEIVKTKYAEKFKSAIPMKPKRVSPLAAFRSGGFIPNFVDFIDVDTLGKNSVHYSGDLMKLIKDIEASIGRNLSAGELRFLSNPKTDLSKLNNIADPNNNQFKQLKTKGTPWTVQDIKGLPISKGIYANGFIPNFAYKQAVMGLEESMSGNKAIFDTKPFPHIRNSSQPTFNSAIADHGGLGNALSDSMRGQKAAGLMSRGFVPNFARGDRGITGRNIEFSTTTGGLLPGMGSKLSDEARKKLIIAINDEIKSFKEGKISRDQLRDNTQKLMDAQKLSTKAQEDLTKKINANVKSVERQNEENKKSISSRIFGKKGEAADAFASSKLGGVAGLLGGSLIGGQLESFIQGGRERYQLSAAEKFGASASSGVLTAATTGAEIGAFIPGLGPAAGAAIGGLIGLGKAAFDAQETLDDMQKTAESYAAMNIKTTEAAKNYIQQLSDIGNITNPADKNIASFKLQETFDEINKVSPELGKKFLEAGGDITKMQEAIKEFVKITNQISSAKKIKSSLFGVSEEFSAIKANPNREKFLKKQGYDIQSGFNLTSNEMFNISQTEASLESSFRQFSGFLEIIRTSGMSAEQATKFMEEFADELSSIYVSQSKLKKIGLKFGLTEELASELAAIGDNVIEEMGVVGKFFIKNSVGFVKKMFDSTIDKFKTAGQQTEKAEFNVRPLLKNIQDNISNFVFKVA